MAASPNHPLVRSHLRAHERRWSADNRTNAISILNRWTAWCAGQGIDLVDATRDDLQAYLNGRCEVVSPNTAHKDYQHLRWFYRFLVTEEEIDSRKVHGPMETVKAPKMVASDPGRVGHVSDEDYERLMASFSKREILDCRNAAICSLMFWSGLRRSEVVRLDRADIDTAKMTGRVLGKNNKYRTFPIAWETVEHIERYLRRRDQAGDEATALFASVGGRGLEHATTGRILPGAIKDMLRRRCAKLGIHVTAHEFRRAMAINSKQRGLSDSAVMTAAGWSDARMLMRYIDRNKQELAADEFHANDPTRIGRARGRRRHRAA